MDPSNEVPEIKTKSANTMMIAGLLAFAVAVRAAEWQPVPGHLMTRWASQVDPARPHPEYPRPQMVRPAWQNLNGLWQFEITGKAAPQPTQFTKQILVPFPVESALSGIKQRVQPKDRLWYRRGFTVPDAWRRGRVLLHFTVSDWSTEVFVNGKSVGRHEGGYDPFGFDVTDALSPGGEQSLVVSVWDPTNEGGQPHGKQTLSKHNIFYTPTSGIWGTVWIEPVPKTCVQSIRMAPDIDAGVLKLTVQADGGTVRAVARDGRKKVGDVTDEHLYPFPPAPRPSATRASVAGECGGLGFNVRGHTWSDAGWGYIRPGIVGTFATEEELTARYEEILDTWPRLAKDPGISGVVYTQLSDIEPENNGLMTFDRAVFKIQPDVSKGRLKGWLPPRKTNPADMFVGAGTVELDAPTGHVGIVYTLDESDPTDKSLVYQKPIQISRDTVVKARAIWPNGGISRMVSFPMRKAEPIAAVVPGPIQPGLQVAAYELKEPPKMLPDFTQLQPARTAVADQVNLKPRPRENNYGLVFEGFLNPPVTGAYVLRVTSDDGAEVVLDGKPVCGKDGVHGDVESVATVALEAGAHPLRIHYFQGVGDQTLRLDWAVPGSPFEEVPARAFSHTQRNP